MRFENLLPLAFASLATAHFVLQLPTNINFDEATEDQAPCGGFSPTDRTGGLSDLAVSGFAIGVVTTHLDVVWEIKAALISDVTNFVNLVPSISQQGTGNWCPVQVPGIPAWIGKDVVLQVKQTNSDGILYQCAAIRFIAGDPGPVDEYCFNSTGVTATYIGGGTSSSTSVTLPPTSSTTSSISSSNSHTHESSSSTTTTTATSPDSHSHSHTTSSSSSTTTAKDSHSQSPTIVSSSTSSRYGNSTSISSAHSQSGDGHGPGSVASTTIVETITSCPPTVTKCPLGQVTTKVIPVDVFKSSVVPEADGIKSSTTSTKSAASVQFTGAATVLEARNLAVLVGAGVAAWFGMRI